MDVPDRYPPGSGEPNAHPKSSSSPIDSSNDFLDLLLAKDELNFKEKIRLFEEFEKRKSNVYHEKKYHNAPKFLQSLSYFFTEEEMQMMPPPDSMLSIDGKNYVVIPNAGSRGNTLFHCLGQAISGKESTYGQLRQIVVNYICSEEGWTAFGQQVVTFYEKFIIEFQSAKTMAQHLGKEELEKFQKMMYRKYMLSQEIDGSLIELVAASALYRFRYACLFLEENDESGRATCHVLRSFDEEEMESVTKAKESKTHGHVGKVCYFVRTKESQDEYRWMLAVPYFNNFIDPEVEEQSYQYANIAKGYYNAECWNVYGLNWRRGKFTVKRSPQHDFGWKYGTSVISTTSGKLLGGYDNLGKDLFSNLCCLLPNCLHKGKCCLLKDIVAYCPKKLRYSSCTDPATFVEKIIENKNKLQRKKDGKKKKHEENSIGTLKDLHRAATIFNFGYYVIEINERGEFQTLRQRYKDTILYIIARTNGNQVVEWLALGDMTNLKPNLAKAKENQIAVFPESENHAICQSARGYTFSKKNNNWMRNSKLFIPLLGSRISRYLSRLQLFGDKTRQRPPQHKVTPFTSTSTA